MKQADRQRYCDFCGLPIPHSLSLGTGKTDEEAEYCCSGCRSVARVQKSSAEQGSAASNLMHLGLAIFFTMNVMVFTMALWSQDIYSEEAFSSEFSHVLRGVFRWASLLFSFPVLWLLGGPIARGVWQALRRKAITTDLLILLGVISAYGFSCVSVLRGSGHVYFEVGSMVLVFVSLGRWLEAKGKRRTNQSLDDLAELLPATVLKKEASGSFVESAREEVVSGDVLRILPGTRLPVDGTIVRGEASIDEQMVTGESQPTEKKDGSPVYSGTLNLDGDLQILVTAADGKETVSRLIEMVRSARLLKGHQEILADRIATWFVPLVCVIALLAAWYHGQAAGFDQGILTGLAVVLIACPCALGLATPMAVWTAFGRAAEGGVLFRSGMVMQELADIGAACFDKTGTLTGGELSVHLLKCAEQYTPDQILKAASALASGSTHPLSKSILIYAREQNREFDNEVTSPVETISGKGLRGVVSTFGEVLLGSRRLMEENNLNWPVELREELQHESPHLQVFLGFQGHTQGVFHFVEQSRPEAAEAVAACKDFGLELCMITGDASNRAEAIAKELEISVQSQQLPDDKFASIETFRTQAKVAMIGDGLNDAPALAAADVGVALGCGADISRDAAGVCLLSDDLRRFPWALGLARLTKRIVVQNLFWAFAYNCIGIGLAVTGRLNPIWAALAMAISSLIVVSNSLRIQRYPDELSINESTHISSSDRWPVSSTAQSLSSSGEFVATTR